MCEIIAACEINWNNLEEAKEMIRQSKSAGATYTKFQFYSWDQIKDDPPYIREHERKIMLDCDLAKELFEYGKEIGQSVFFSCMFEEAVDWCEEIGVELYKIRYADRYNYPLVEKVLKTGKRVIMSIDANYILWGDMRRISFLWCVSKYPADDRDYNFTCRNFILFSGVSDHTKGLNIIKRVHGCGGNLIVEKHVKLNDKCIEKDWSVTFKELEEVLGR